MLKSIKYKEYLKEDETEHLLNSTHLQVVQDVDEFVSSSEEIWRNVALHHLLTDASSAG